MKNEMAQDLNELQRLEFKEAFEEFDKVCYILSKVFNRSIMKLVAFNVSVLLRIRSIVEK